MHENSTNVAFDFLFSPSLMFSTFRSFRPCAVYDLTAVQSVTYVSFQFSNNFGFTNSCTKLARQWSFPKQLKFRPFSVPLYRLYEEKKIHRTKTTAKKVSSLRNTKLTVTFGERPFGNDPCSFAFWVFYFSSYSLRVSKSYTNVLNLIHWTAVNIRIKSKLLCQLSANA